MLSKSGSSKPLLASSALLDDLKDRFLITSGESGEVTVHQLVNQDLLLKDKLEKVEGSTAREWLTLHPELPIIYTFASFWKPMSKVKRKDTRSGEMTVLSIHPLTGKLQVEAVFDTLGCQPCAAAVSPDHKSLAIAHYLDGRVTVFPLQAATGMPSHPARVLKLPWKGTEISDEDRLLDGTTGPLCHGVAFSMDGRWLLGCDAGQGRLVAFQTSGGQSTVVTDVTSQNHHLGFFQRLLIGKLGPRPRHCAFHPTQGFLYVLYECTNMVTSHRFDETTGCVSDALCEVDVGQIAAGTCCCCLRGITAPAEIEVSQDGLAVFTSTRGVFTSSSLASFHVKPNGGLERNTITDALGRSPRHFCSFGELIVVGLERSSAISVFHTMDGRLTPLAKLEVQGIKSGPQCVQVFPMKHSSPYIGGHIH